MKTTPFGKNVAAIRLSKGMTQQEFANAIGVTQNSVSAWETRGRMPRKAQIEAIKEIFRLTDDDLLSDTAGFDAKLTGLVAPEPSNTYAPIAGFAPCGEPHGMVWELTNQRHWVPPHILERWPDGFFVHVHGDSMDRVLPDGAFAFVAPGAECSGHVALVKVNGDEATVKRVTVGDGIVVLTPDSTNPEHRRRVIDETDPDAPQVRVIGRVVWMDCNL